MMSPKGIFAEQPPGVAPTSIKRLARIAGVFYLIVGITGGFSEGFVDPSMYVAGDATATTGNLVANSGLVRLAVIAHLTDAVFFVLTAVTLYVLLKHVGKHAGRLMVLPVVVAAAIISVSTVFTFAALTGSNERFLRGGIRRGRSECARAAPAGDRALRNPRRAGLLRAVASPAGVSRLSVRTVPKVARHHPHRCHGQLRDGRRRGVLASRSCCADSHLPGHRARDCGDLDGPVPADSRGAVRSPPREWGAANGFNVSGRGRVSTELQNAYHAAN